MSHDKGVMRRSSIILFIFLAAILPLAAFAEGGLKLASTIKAPGAVIDLRYSADGSKIAAAVGSTVCLYGKDGKLVKRFGVKDGQDINAMDYANGMVATYAYTNPAQILLWKEDGSAAGKLGYIAKEADEASVVPECETAAPYRIRFTKDGKSLALVSKTDNFGGVKLWDLATGKVKLGKGFEDTSVYGLSMCPDGASFAAFSRDEQVRVYDYKAALRSQFSTQDDEFNTAYNGKDIGALDGGSFAILKGPELSIWGADGKRKAVVPAANPDASNAALAASPDGKLFAVAYEEQGFSVYKDDGSLVATCETEDPSLGIPAAVTGISFSPDGSAVAVALGEAACIQVYSLK